MKQPLFAVGEVVIAVPKAYPEAHGEYPVMEILDPSDAAAEFPTFVISNQIYYRLDGFMVHGDWNGDMCNIAGESSLRKKHQPGEQSFSELMSNLKMGQPA